MSYESYKGFYYIKINDKKYTSEQLKLIFRGDEINGLQYKLQEKEQRNTGYNSV